MLPGETVNTVLKVATSESVNTFDLKGSVLRFILLPLAFHVHTFREKPNEKRDENISRRTFCLSFPSLVYVCRLQLVFTA